MTTNGDHENVLKRAVHAVEDTVRDLLDDEDDDTFTQRPGAKDPVE